MKNRQTDKSFEDSLAALKDLQKKIEDPTTPLNDMIAAYKQAADYYLSCINTLDDAEQQVKFIDEMISETADE